MSRSSLCAMCGRDPDTGETFCVRLGEWVAKCPKHDGPSPWDAENVDLSETENEGEENE